MLMNLSTLKEEKNISVPYHHNRRFATQQSYTAKDDLIIGVILLWKPRKAEAKSTEVIHTVTDVDMSSWSEKV